MILDALGQEQLTQENARFTDDDARLIRAYKLMLQKYGLAAVHYCRQCQRAERDAEIRIIAQPGKIEFECQHRFIRFMGHTWSS